MKDDQVVRIAASLSLAVIYAAHKGFNGSGPVDVPFAGMVAPLVLVVTAELILAFPELLDRLPFGPTRAPASQVADVPDEDPREKG